MGQRGWSIGPAWVVHRSAFPSSLNCKRASTFHRVMPKSPSYFRAKRAKPPMFCSAFLWEVEARDLVAQRRPLTELAHIGPFLARTSTGIAIHPSLQRIAFLNPAMPQHESAPFLRIFCD